MDSIASSALEEICSAGAAGLSLPVLWSRLAPALAAGGLDLSPGVKASVWAALLGNPSLEFRARARALAPADGAIRRVEDAEEKEDLKVVASESLRDVFVGLYDAQLATANIKGNQRRVLERLALGRMKGVTQSQLCKEFGMDGKYMFYILKSLESRGLIMKHSALVRTNEPGAEGESRNSSSVTTNVLYLYRYAKQLGLQQKFEITRDEEQTYEGFEDSGETFAGEECLPGDYAKENVVVKDYLPAMKAICDKLEATEGKVLVVSDIKQHLGYHGAPSAHKAWRNICRRLKDAHLVKEFEAKVNGKVQKCLRLLKNFPPESIEPQPLGSRKSDQGEEFLNFGRRSLVTEQTVELPIEHQVFDMIDAEGPKGLVMKEACKRLGIGSKQNHSRLLNMFTRFGIHLEAQNSKKGFVYRAWTPKNFDKVSADAFALEVNNVDGGSGNSKLDLVDKVSPYLPENFTSASEGPFVKLNGTGTLSELPHGNKEGIEADDVLALVVEPKRLVHQPEVSGLDSEVDLVVLPNEKSIVPSEPSPPSSSRSRKSELHQRYPCLSLTADGARREQRILEKVQREKFVLRGELYRWLVNFEKDKRTTMDRKTIDRIVNKLQKQGKCKCAHLEVPAVTNCRRIRSIQVVLHPSIENLSPELISEIHDRMRSFEMLSRGHGSSNQKNKQSVPVLDSVERIQSCIYSDVAATKSEAMRANGFVLAKMVRAKLLHCFLWDYSHTASGHDHDHDFVPTSTSDANNPHSSCRLFSLDEAIKAIPLELFLQIAGSAQKFDDMINKCKRGFCLADLPDEEYRVLMDTQATGRLSVIIDILRRLKLIRLVNYGHREDGVKVPHAVLTDALELKPYIEEPLSSVAKSMSLVSLDLRPRIRHDFFLSNRGAVDEYWHTLEYCYAATDPRAAIHAFPGSAVHEVFFFRSWASVRVMTAEQRAELLKRIVMDANEKLPYHECEKIAKDLNLTLEQVLRVYYDRRQKRLNRFYGTQNASRKRKRSSEEVLSEHDGIGALTKLGHGNNDLPSDSAEQFTEEQVKFLPSLDKPGFQSQDGELVDCLEEPRPNEGVEGCSSRTSQHEPTGMRAARQRRFLWSDESDRQLVILYARNRAFVGAKFHRTDWASLPNLPAPPSTCGKRMASLNKRDVFRKSLMRLCNLLSERYIKHLQKSQEKPCDDGQFVRSIVELGHSADFSTISELTEHNAFKEDRWDDFSAEPINTVLEEVLQCKRMNKLEVSKSVGSSTKEWSDLNIGSQHDSQVLGYVSSANTHKDSQKKTGGQNKGTLRRSKSSCRRLQRKFIRLWNDGGHVSGHICESLAVSNAVELFKLVFLNSSTAPEVPSLLAESLRRYSQHDLFSAFSYLREKKILIGGSGSQPFTLSQNFLHDISKSMFPADTGKRVAKFSRWLHERETDLDNEEIVPMDDLQCGDTIYLFALVSSGEIFLCPSLPEEGVGEAEESRNLKRRADDNESYGGSKYKKLKSTSECEVVSRREKGFPGIMVSVQRATILMASSLELFKDAELRAGQQSIQNNDTTCSMLLQTESNSSSSDCVKEIVTSANTINISGLANGTIWDSMTRYANEVNFSRTVLEQGSFIDPNVFRVLYGAIHRAGDQGLSMREISDVVDMPGLTTPELLIEVLQLFGLALKVNSFDSVRVVDSLYRSKYFLTSITGSRQDRKELSSMESLMRIEEDHLICPPKNDDLFGDNSERETITNIDQMHKITILNLPEESDVSAAEVQNSNVPEEPMEGEVNLPRGTLEIECSNFSPGRLCMPILPWINGDGTVNRLVYRALVRRVLGIVMFNPGILEDEIIGRLDVLNPQSCRKLLELMVLDKHLIVRKMNQTLGSEPPRVMRSLLGDHFRKSKFICREHFFANPMSASLL